MLNYLLRYYLKYQYLRSDQILQLATNKELWKELVKLDLQRIGETKSSVSSTRIGTTLIEFIDQVQV